MTNKIRVVIADDHPLFAEGLRVLLERSYAIEVVEIVNDGRELLNILKTKQADILLLDLSMPKLNGFEVMKYLKMQDLQLKIISLSTYTEIHLVNKAKELGAHGYIMKNSNQEQLIESIYAVFEGNPSFPNTAESPTVYNTQADLFLKAFQLSKREKEIIQFIKQGLTNKEIAEHLFLSVYTVETHRKNIMQKLQLKSPAALMKFIIENSL